MSILADTKTRRLATAHRMIEPFVEGQVRQLENNLRVIGYDRRVADEFKDFTNIFNTVVDQKTVDPNNWRWLSMTNQQPRSSRAVPVLP